MRKKLRSTIVIGLLLLFTGTCVKAQWLINGNSTGINDYIGTNNNTPFRIRTNGTEKMFIGSSGFVGIGTSTQVGLGQFVVSGGVNSWSGMYVNGNNSTIKSFYGYSTGNSAKAWHYFDPSNSTWKLSINNSDVLTVNLNGNMGVGTTTPNARFHAIGSGIFSEDLSIGGNTDIGGDVTISGSTTANAMTLNGDLTVNGEVDFNNAGTFTCNKVNAFTNSSQAAVMGTAVSGTLNSYGVMGNSNGNYYAYGVYCMGNSMTTGDVEYWGDSYQVSDAQFKTNIIGMRKSLDIILQLKPSQYNFKTDEKFNQFNFKTETDYGFIAQEIEKVIPGLVKNKTRPIDINKPEGEKIDFKMVDYVGLIPFLTGAIQEQQTIIEDQKTKIDEMDQRLKKLEGSMSFNNRLDGGNSNQSTNRLYVNNPNPFDKQTTIRYSIDPNSTHASILVMDLNGKVINTFEILQKGEGSINISADQLSAGIYNNFLMVDGNIVSSQKMIVSK